MQRLHERIKQIRGDMSREEFAPLVGISPRALITYEQNERTPKADLLNRICAETNVSPEWLLMGTGPVYGGGIVPPSEASDTAKTPTCRRLRNCNSLKNNALEKDVPPTVGGFSPEEFSALQRELREQDKELRDLLRQTGDLRVENAELRARVRDLERELREALNPEGGTPPVASAG